MPILADLFLTFAKIGCFTFGGGLAGALTATAASCLPAALICAKKLMKKKYSPVILILFAAVAGIVFY